MAWILWLLGSFFYIYQFFFRSLFPTLADELSYCYDVSIPHLSVFFSSGLLSYSLVQLPGGILFDRFGPRIMMSFGMGFMSFGLLLIGLLDELWLGVLGRVIFGAGAGFGFLGLTTLISLSFSQKMVPFLLGLSIFFGSMIGAFSRSMFEPLTQGQWDWQKVLVLMSVMGFCSIFLFLFFIPKKKDSVPFNGKKLLQSLKFILSHKQILLCSLTSFFGYSIISVIADSWGVKAFETLYHVPKEIANKTPFYFYIPFSFGSLFFSTLASWLNSPRKILLVELTGVVGILSAMLLDPSLLKDVLFLDTPIFLLWTGLLGFFIGGIGLTFPIGCRYISAEMTATAVGVMNTFCMFSGGLYAQVLGSILHANWDGQIGPDGFAIFSDIAYGRALEPLIVAALLSLFMVFMIDEK